MRLGKINLGFLNSKNKAAAGENHQFIELRNVVKIYQGPSGGFQAIKNVNLNISAGEFVAIAGKSGSGKSTLLNMITGIDRPSSGEIFVNNAPIHLMSEEKLTIWRGVTIGIVFQFFQLIPTMTLLENVILPMDFCRTGTPRQRRERALQLLKEVGLEEFAGRLPSNVSGGQQQRAAIARALANDPQLIVADEPTGNLDSATAEAVFSLLERLVEQGKTVVIVTHDNELASRCQRIVTISDGCIVQDQPNTKDGRPGSAASARSQAAEDQETTSPAGGDILEPQAEQG